MKRLATFVLIGGVIATMFSGAVLYGPKGLYAASVASGVIYLIILILWAKPWREI